MLDQSAPVSQAELDRPAIVVVAPVNTGKALAECLARQCSVIDDVNATIRHAEALFAAGKYPDARATLLRSLSRNRDAVGQYPRAVAALYEAGATVAEHNGDREEYRTLALKSAYIIAQAPSLSSVERVTGHISAGDIYVALEDRASAEHSYLEAEDLARRDGLAKLAQAIELRRLWISGKPRDSRRQRMRLAAIIAAADTDPKLILHAQTILARLERQDGDQGATDRLVAAIQAQPAGDAPILAWSPPVPATAEQDEAKGERRYNSGSSSKQQSGVRQYQWADIGYWVRPDGLVTDTDILRGSPDTGWAKPIVSMISRRRYLASKAAADDPGQYRIERVTLTYEWLTPIGSLIRRRIGEPSYRFTDLTHEPAPPAANSAQ